MPEIKFLVINDSTSGAVALNQLLNQFENKNGVRVEVELVTWSQAWLTLLSTALHGKGPDLAHIGSTWNASLASMNSLRPFSPNEVASMGGAEAFFPCTWQSTIMYDDSRVWAIPWTAYTFLVHYRRDLLQRAGIDEHSAFSTPEAMLETLARLKSSGPEAPWLIPTASPFPDILHIAASWVWGAGGDYVTPDGRRTRFADAQALAGFKPFFELYRYLPPAYYRLDQEACLNRFIRGQAAVLVAGPEPAFYITQNPTDVDPKVRENMGVASLPGIPWVGGDNLVIWWHTAGYPEQERYSIELVRFLTNATTQVAYSREGNLPTRPDALAEMDFPDPSFGAAVHRALQTGRSHHAVHLWGRIEVQLEQALEMISAEILETPETTVESAIHHHLEPLARRLNLTLNQ